MSNVREEVLETARDAKETLALIKKSLFLDPKTAHERLRVTVSDDQIYRYIEAMHKTWTMDRDLTFDADYRLRVVMNLFGFRTDIENQGRCGFSLDKWTELPLPSEIEIAVGRWQALVDTLAFVCGERGLLTNKLESSASNAKKRPRSDFEGNTDVVAALSYLRARVGLAGNWLKASLLYRYSDDPDYRPPNLLASETNGIMADEKTSFHYKIRYNLLRFAKMYNLGLSKSEREEDAFVMQEVISRSGYKTRTWKPLKMPPGLEPLKQLFRMMGNNPDDACSTEQFWPENELTGTDLFATPEERAQGIAGQNGSLPANLSTFSRKRSRGLAYEKVTLKAFVTALLDVGCNQNIYRQCMVNPMTIIKNMTVDSDMMPVKVPMRNVNSYETGVYVGYLNKFHPYVEGNVPEDLVACKYTPCYFDPNWVSCPIDDVGLEPGKPLVHERVLSDQDLTPAQIRDVEFMMGRAQMPQGTDGYHAGLILIGCPGAGKSLLLTIFRALFPNRYVGVLSGDEAVFGTSNLRDKWVFICNEIASNMSQIGEKILCLLSYDYTSHAQKFNGAYTGRLKCNGIMSGNRYFKFDTAGAMSRRMIVVYMMNKPPVVIVDLASQIHRELGAFQCRTLRRYHEMLNRIPSNIDLINFLDPFFTNNQKKMTSTINPYQGFLDRCNFVYCDSDEFENRLCQIGLARERGDIDEDMAIELERDAYLSRPYVPVDLFVDLFKTYINRTKDFTVSNVDPTEYTPILRNNGIQTIEKPGSGIQWMEARETQDGRNGRRYATNVDIDAVYPNPEGCRSIVRDACPILVGIGITNWKSAYVANPEEGRSNKEYLKDIRNNADVALKPLYLPSNLKFPHVDAFKKKTSSESSSSTSSRSQQ